MLLLVDIVLVVIVLEAVLLVAVSGRRRGGLAAVLDVVPNLASGACLVLALRTVLTDLPSAWTVMFLSLSFIAHLADLRRRGFVGRPRSGSDPGRARIRN